jgi:hypothetical protein
MEYPHTMDYTIFGKAIPPYPRSTLITGVKPDKYRYHQGSGDMWPITWGADDNLYGGAGDNRNSPMNFWRIRGKPEMYPKGPYSNQNAWFLDLIDNLPIDPVVYCTDPAVDPKWGIKPAGLLDVDGLLYFAVEAQNYGFDAAFTRQENVHGWIITSDNYGQTWNKHATSRYFFTKRLSSVHFLQFGKGYQGARDQFVYAYFPAADDGNSYWENGDFMLLGRVLKDKILVRDAWEFYVGQDSVHPTWNNDDSLAVPVFRYNRMCGENHVSYNPGLKRYILGNYSFVDDNMNPRPNHQGTWPQSAYRSQLSLYESPEPWGPWSLFYQDDDWGTYGDYQPSFPPKWISDDGKIMFMVSSGTYDDYNWTVQKFTLEINETH